MIDPTLQNQVVQAALQAANRSRKINLADLWERFANVDVGRVQAYLQKEQAVYRYGAVPTREPLGMGYQTNAHGTLVMGVDGSQIYPDPYAPVLWGYIQALAYIQGVQPRLCSEFLDLGKRAEDDPEKNENGYLSGLQNTDDGFVNYWRTLLEMRVAGEALQKNPEGLLLVDNPLLPWIGLADVGQNAWVEEYLRRLEQVRGSLIAGVVSSPRSRLLTSLMDLDSRLAGQDSAYALLGVTDSMLMGHGLQAGQRSALFLYAGPRNHMFAQAKAAIYFFFLRINAYEIARVEIPEWVAQDAPAVELVHASVLADSQALGYPLALAFAHHMITIPLDVATALHRLASDTFVRAGGYYYLPAKLRMKTAFRP